MDRFFQCINCMRELHVSSDYKGNLCPGCKKLREATVYSHADMVKLCNEAKRDQRHACAEALTTCNKIFPGCLISLDEAHMKVMNEDI